MKQVTTILLVLLMLLQTLSKVWIVVSFKINQDTIAKTLCVKKDIENNTCQGKCHLKEQIDKADEQEKKQIPTTQKEKVEILYCYNIQPFELSNNIIDLHERKLLYAYKNDFLSSSFLTDIFHPPEFLFV